MDYDDPTQLRRPEVGRIGSLCWPNALSPLRQLPHQIEAPTFDALNAVVRPAVRVGLGNPLPVGGGLVLVETTGRRSGLPRQAPLVAGRVGNSLVVSTVRADSQWLRNLEAEPRVRVWLAGRARSDTASVRRGRLNIATLTLSGA